MFRRCERPFLDESSDEPFALLHASDRNDRRLPQCAQPMPEPSGASPARVQDWFHGAGPGVYQSVLAIN